MNIENKKTRRQDERAEETKRNIAESAGKLFTARGYDAVTIREIAKEAGCSHTTIYLYYKDKEALLEQLAIDPLMELEQSILAIRQHGERSASQKLKEISNTLVRFCLSHKSMVSMILEDKSVRANEQNTEGEVNKLRTRIVAHLSNSLVQALSTCERQTEAEYSHIYLFMLKGWIHTYLNEEEALESLLARTVPLLDEGLDLLLSGMRQKIEGEQPEQREESEEPKEPVTISKAVKAVEPDLQPKMKSKEKSKEKSKASKDGRKEKKQNKKGKDKKSKAQEE